MKHHFIYAGQSRNGREVCFVEVSSEVDGTPAKESTIATMSPQSARLVARTIKEPQLRGSFIREIEKAAAAATARRDEGKRNKLLELRDAKKKLDDDIRRLESQLADLDKEEESNG